MKTVLRFRPQAFPLLWPLSMNDPGQRAICDEHSALLRQMAVLQRRVSDQLLEQAHRVNAIESENLRLRAELVRSRTAVLWGLHTAAVGTPIRPLAPRPSAPVAREWPEAQAVICQTGCVGHAHAWLDEQGKCRRTGEVCHPPGSASADHDPSSQSEEPDAD